MSKSQLMAPTKRHSVHSEVKALGVVMTGEFGVPFRIFDANSAEEVSLTTADSPAARREVEISFVRQAALDGQCRVHRLDDLNNHLTLVIFAADRPALVALGVMRSLVGAGSERSRELEQVQKWLQTFGDRLRLNDLYATQRRSAADQEVQLKRTGK